MSTVHACPQCGQELLHTCWHDGDDVSAVDMPVEQAIKLTSLWIEDAEDSLERRREGLARYKAMLPPPEWKAPPGYARAVEIKAPGVATHGRDYEIAAVWKQDKVVLAPGVLFMKKKEPGLFRVHNVNVKHRCCLAFQVPLFGEQLSVNANSLYTCLFDEIEAVMTPASILGPLHGVGTIEERQHQGGEDAGTHVGGAD